MTNLQGRERAAYVRGMFGRIAHRYDLMNRLMTFGRDRAWRRYLIQQADLPPGGTFLDVATGTGDIAFEALDQHPDLRLVAGADFSAPMMQVGKTRPNSERIVWCEGDALRLPFPAGRFDACASGYLMRNVGDIEGAFREQWRVLKPGGVALCLDTSPPPRNFLYPLIMFHFRFVIPLLGRLIAGDDSAYSYLPESTEGFKSPDELAAIMEQAGFEEVRYRRFMLGTMAVHIGRK